MGVEVAEMTQVPVETVSVPEVVAKPFMHEKENGKLEQEVAGNNEPIKFGSHVEEPLKGEEKKAAAENLPKDAVDEWPAPKQIHSFYFVRCRTYEDPKMKAKFDYADREVQKMNQNRFRLMEELKAKRNDRSEIVSQLRALRTESRQFKSIMDEKKKEMEPLQQALGKLRTPNNAGRAGGICSSEEELNDLLHSLQYRIQHESIPLSEEKQILREIKQLEGTREKVQANAAVRAKIQDSMGQKDVIQDQVKLMGADLDGVRKEQNSIWKKSVNLEEKVKALEEEIKALQDQVSTVTEKRDKAYQTIQELRKQRDLGNALFFQYRQTMNKAKDLAIKKDIEALQEFTDAEGEKFMTQWNNNKAFRDDYEKRILSSLDSRQLSRDGRIRNPDEKPLVVVEASVPSEPEIVAKANVKRPKEDSKAPPQRDTKVQKEAVNKVTDSKSPADQTDIVAADKEISNSVLERPPPQKKVDPAKLKEMKREEEIAKAKQAMERKKKLAEKAAAKAAIRAQKEAEKKLKEREKKAKKKATTSGMNEESADSVTENEEPEKAEENVEAPVEAPVPAKKSKVSNVKNRVKTRGPEALPKAILKRKKSNNYLVWAAPAAAIVLLILALVYYYYLM